MRLKQNLINRGVNMDFEVAKKELQKLNKTIVLPEGDDVRILKAGVRLAEDKIANVILLGNEAEITNMAKENNLDIGRLKLLII